VRTEDLAKFGQLYRQQGQWNGKQLLPASWIEMASSKQVSNGSNPKSDWNQGYGFQFWRCRHGAFRGDGAFGQYCVVMPDQDAVLAITSGVRDMQAVLDLVWEGFLPACEPKALASDRAAHAQLLETLARLELVPAKGAASVPVAGKVLNRSWVFPANEQKLERVSLEGTEGGQAISLVVRWAGQTLTLPAGHRDWRAGRAYLPAGRLAQFPDEPVAGTFGWPAEDTLEVKVCAYETPFHLTYRLKFAGDQVTLDQEANVSFGSRTQPTLVGRLAAGETPD
jgi:hypothetical protein